MLEISYVITSEIPDNPRVEHLYWLGQIEGDLKLEINGQTCLVSEAELLLAVAVIMRRWLRILENAPLAEFYYRSMELEEEPVLRFVSIPGTDRWELESVLENKLRPVPREALLKGVQDFLNDLESELSNNHPVDLESEYQEHVEDYLREFHPTL